MHPSYFQTHDDTVRAHTGDLTLDMSHAEFTCRCAQRPEGPFSDCLGFHMDEGVIEGAQAVRDVIERPLIINRGYSCVEHNRTLGSKDTSQHIQGLAIDCYAWGIPPIALGWIFRTMEWRCVIVHKTFVHADRRPGACYFEGF